MPGGWTIGGQEAKPKRSSMLLDQDVKIYSQISNDSDYKWWRNFNKASTLNTEVNNTQTEMNIDALGLDDTSELCKGKMNQ